MASFVFHAVPIFVLATSALAQQGTTQLVSVNSAGAAGRADTGLASISADGLCVAFRSDATNLVSGDTNNQGDIFVHDRPSGVTTRVSVGTGGTQASGASMLGGLSKDGRFVAFSSYAPDLVAGDTNGFGDAFVHDRASGATTRVSVDSNGAEANGQSGYGPCAISGDGRLVAFHSGASNLVPNDTNGHFDVFLHDRANGQTRMLSVNSLGVQGNRPSSWPSISQDGRFVSFASGAPNLVAGDVNAAHDVFVCELSTGQLTLASVGSNGSQANDASYGSSLSADGRYVAFDSRANNLASSDNNEHQDIYVHDRVTGRTVHASPAASGYSSNHMSWRPSISGDGRFVGFTSLAGNLVPGGQYQHEDVYVRDLEIGKTLRASVNTSGALSNGVSWLITLSGDGRTVAFTSAASDLVQGDLAGVDDAFVRELECWAPASYCISGLSSTSFCNATMSWSGSPSASASSGFTLTCSGIEGQRGCALFYGTSGAQAIPWAQSGSSLLCVLPPTQRLAMQSSGGTAGNCDGSISLDFLAFQAAHPTALGQPLAPSERFYVQAWYRDPLAPKFTNLSDAVAFELCP